MAPNLRGTANIQMKEVGRNVITVAGWEGCGFYRKSRQTISTLELLFPDKITLEDINFPDRDAYRGWLDDEKKNNDFGEKGNKHTSSPFVRINGSFLGGCDDSLDFAKDFCLSSGQGLAPISNESKSSTVTSSDAVMVDDGFTKEHGFDYDLIVIGGGSGGLAASKEAAVLGARVALLDFVKPSPQGSKWGLGGTCVNVGCIPKKLMHTAALLGETKHDMVNFGWDSQLNGHSWETMRENVQNYIKSLNFGYRVALRDKNVTYLNKLGKFLDQHTLEVVDKKGKVSTLTAARFIVGVGGRPSPLPCPGAEHCITSDDLFSLPSGPGKTLIVGAGYVALECGGFLTALGYDTTVMVRSILLRGFDRECCDKIGEVMEAKGTKFLKEVTPTSVEKLESGKLLVKMSNGHEEEFDTVMAAMGRYADTPSLNIPSVGCEMNERNGKFICQNEQTSVPNVYAIGDVVDGKPELTPVAIQAGIMLARRLFGSSNETMNYKEIATTIFTPLEYGTVGYSEEEANEVFGEGNFEVYHSSYKPLEWTLSPDRGHESAFAKVLVLRSNDKVIGMHYCGPNAGEVIQGYGVAVKAGLTYKTLLDTVGIHPTVAEEFTMLTISKSSGQSAEKSGC